MSAANYALETKTIQRVASHPQCRFIWTKHVLERMAERKIEASAIKRVLITGQVTLEETAKKDICWRVEGTDVDGCKLEAVVAVFEGAIKIKVITVFES
jgi:Domain of unknown function (DUF4258)